MSGSRMRMRDVANAAGVSAMTVSRALRGDARVAPDTRERVLAEVRRLDYAPDENARSLSRRRSGFVAALVPSLNNPHFAETVRGLAEALEPGGLQVLIGHTNYDPTREERLVRDVLRRRPEAIVITADAHSAATRALLRGSGVPVVQIWDWPSRPFGHVVGFSNRAAARAMAEHLIAAGCRRIVFVGESADAGTRGSRRRQGYLDAIAAAGLGAPRLAALAPPPVTMLQARAGLRGILARWPDADALMGVSDPCAFGLLCEAQALGIDVPGRLAIAGFGDFEVSRCCRPALSTVAMDATALGLEAGRLVDALLSRGPPGAPLRKIRVPVAILARGSTSPAADAEVAKSLPTAYCAPATASTPSGGARSSAG